MAAKLPRKPDLARLGKIDAETVTLPASTLVSRVYMRGGQHPTKWYSWRHYGPLKTSRFDHHVPDGAGKAVLQDRGIAYGAVSRQGKRSIQALACCLAEVYQKNRRIDPHENNPYWAVFRLQEALTLLDLRGAWPTRAGASQAINSGDKASARAWSQAFYDVYPEIHGIIYPSSMHGGVDAVALNERALRVGAIPGHATVNHALGDPKISAMLRNAARQIGYRLQL